VARSNPGSYPDMDGGNDMQTVTQEPRDFRTGDGEALSIVSACRRIARRVANCSAARVGRLVSLGFGNCGGMEAEPMT